MFIQDFYPLPIITSIKKIPRHRIFTNAETTEEVRTHKTTLSSTGGCGVGEGKRIRWANCEGLWEEKHGWRAGLRSQSTQPPKVMTLKETTLIFGHADSLCLRVS